MSSHRRKAAIVVLKEDRVSGGVMDKGLLPSKAKVKAFQMEDWRREG